MLKLAVFTSLVLFTVIKQGNCVSDFTETACFGIVDDFLKINCSNTDEKIAIYELSFIAKNNTAPWLDCGPPLANNSAVHCCVYDSQDCAVDVFSTLDETKYSPIFSNCTGFGNCIERTSWVSAITSCTSDHFFFTSYMQAKYQCIPEALSIPSGTDKELKSDEVYLQNAGYPEGSNTSDVLSCSMETNCDAYVEITTIDVSLASSTGTINSSHNNKYKFTDINITTDHFLTLNITFTKGAKLWIRVKANDSSEVDVRCGSKMITSPIESCLPTTVPPSTASPPPTSSPRPTLAPPPTSATPPTSVPPTTTPVAGVTQPLIQSTKFPAENADINIVAIVVPIVVVAVLVVGILLCGYYYKKRYKARTAKVSDHNNSTDLDTFGKTEMIKSVAPLSVQNHPPLRRWDDKPEGLPAKTKTLTDIQTS